MNKKEKEEYEEKVIDTSKPRNTPSEDERLYRIHINGTPIDVDACTLYFAKGRVNKYLQVLKEEALSQTGSLRSFWADVILLNLITNNMLTEAKPYVIEKMLNPVKYMSPQKAVEFYKAEQAKVEAQRKAEQDGDENNRNNEEVGDK